MTAGGKAADGAIGILNGLIGGATGLAGIVATIWCALRGWPRDGQRTVFQAVGVAVFLMTGLWLGGMGLVGGGTIGLFAIGLPALLSGTWLGLKLYTRLDGAGFRKVVLALLLISGLGLVMTLFPPKRDACLSSAISVIRALAVPPLDAGVNESNAGGRSRL